MSLPVSFSPLAETDCNHTPNLYNQGTSQCPPSHLFEVMKNLCDVAAKHIYLQLIKFWGNSKIVFGLMYIRLTNP